MGFERVLYAGKDDGGVTAVEPGRKDLMFKPRTQGQSHLRSQLLFQLVQPLIDFHYLGQIPFLQTYRKGIVNARRFRLPSGE